MVLLLSCNCGNSYKCKVYEIIRVFKGGFDLFKEISEDFFEEVMF